MGGLSIPAGHGAGNGGRRPRVLVAYAADDWPLRTAIADHLFAWRRHGPFEPVFFNAKRRRLTDRIVRKGFELVVFHTTLLAQRWNPAAFEAIRGHLEPLKRVSVPRIAIPQDEFLHTTLLCDFLAEFEVGYVLSCARSSEWSKIYGRLDPQPRFDTVLTGYLEPRTLARIERLRRRSPAVRPIDIGYRAWRAQPWLGRHGMLKTTLGEAVLARAGQHGLQVDISLDEAATLLGDDWLRFLLSSRFVIGVEGGASVLDADGTVKVCTEDYRARHPEATFDEIEAACFPGRDGELDLFAISPRHLEAIATRTGQLLVEGRYNDVLRADEHYIPIRNDLSDLDRALGLVRDEGLFERMTARAYDDVVRSGRYTYAVFIRQAIDLLGYAIDPLPERSHGRSANLRADLVDVSDLPSRASLVVRSRLMRGLGAVGLVGPARGAWRRVRRMLGRGR